jgi:hypothetical protein
MSAEVAADRPPDPQAHRLSGGGIPVAKSSNRPDDHSEPQHACGETAFAAGTLTSHRLAALPILDRLLTPLRIELFLRDHMPGEDSRSRVPTATALLILLKNLLISREPLYGVGEWAARYLPQLLGLTPAQAASG